MAIPTSRETLKQYCLRDLGAPVIEINVDDDQLEDRIDQALQYWTLYHYEGIEEMYLKQQIRASLITLVDPIAQNFHLEEKVTGVTSGATAHVCNQSDVPSTGTNLLVKNIVGTFIDGEDIVSETTNITTTTVSIEVREYDKRYVDLPDYVWGVTKILSIGQASSSKNIFDLQYQLRLNDLYDLTSTSIIYYKTVMNHLALLDFELNGPQSFRFNRISNRLYIDCNWQTDLILGDYIIVQGYRAEDPAQWTKVWNENWMKRYTTALFKRQWGTNMKKFGGLQLPGGVVLNGKETFDEANQEIQMLEDELQNKSAPLNFFMG
jgi:hypothetical protein